ELGERADRARQRAGRDLAARLLQAPPVARELSVEPGELQSEGRGLGMNAVRAPDAYGVLVLVCALLERLEHAVKVTEQEVGGRPELQGKRGVQEIRRGHAEVQVTRLGADHPLDV